jgi:hypothetical protein
MKTTRDMDIGELMLSLSDQLLAWAERDTLPGPHREQRVRDAFYMYCYSAAKNMYNHRAKVDHDN